MEEFQFAIYIAEDIRFCDDDPSPGCPGNHTYIDFDFENRSVVRSHCMAKDGWLPHSIELNEKVR